ncbi:MAG TPA: cyclic nucleotide-binding domain-containing protein [Cellvibrionaceae bacterium]
MEIKPLQKFHRETIEQLLSAIPFFRSVKQYDQAQFDQLLQYSKIITYRPSEVVLQRGDGDQWLYFLLKGRLAVYAGDELGNEPVNYITPGEVFGDLARLTRKPRSATIVADSSCREAMVFSADFSLFDDLNSTRPISLHTKLLYYRNTVHNLRWKLEMYRTQHPGNALADKHRQIKLYMGSKDTADELLSLHEQARALAELLFSWNRGLGSVGQDASSRDLLSAQEDQAG